MAPITTMLSESFVTAFHFQRLALKMRLARCAVTVRTIFMIVILSLLMLNLMGSAASTSPAVLNQSQALSGTEIVAPAATGNIPATPVDATMVQALGQQPLAFIPNRGQTAPQAQYYVNSLGGTLFFTPQELVLSLPHERSEVETALPHNVLRVQFVEANSATYINSGEPLDGVVNYFIGNDPTRWRTYIPTYASLLYTSLYPGIDLHYTGTEGKLKSTYRIAAGADPTQIRWRYEGAAAVRVNEMGDLEITLASRTDKVTTANDDNIILSEKAPIAWQEIDGQLVPVKVRYTLFDGHSSSGSNPAPGTLTKSSIRNPKSKTSSLAVGFALGAYDPAYPLVIDPLILVYSTYLGGNHRDAVNDIAVDSYGNAYIAGFTLSADFPPQNAYDPDHNGATDAFVTKLAPDGRTLVYSTYLGGNDFDVAYGITVDSEGNAYVSGTTISTNFPMKNAYDSSPNGSFDVFVTKLAAYGRPLVYSTYLGGSGPDEGNGQIVVDSTGNVYITGETESTDFPPQNAYDPAHNGATDAFVTKLAADGRALIYSTYLGGSGPDDGRDIGVDSAGNAYVTGETASTNFPPQNAYDPDHNGATDAFVTKLAADGRALVYSTYLGGSGREAGNGIAVDGAGNAFIIGTTTTSNGFPLQQAYDGTHNGGRDVYVTKLAADGSVPVYNTYLGGNVDDFGTDIDIDGAGNAYVTGETKSTDFPIRHPYVDTLTGGFDVFVTKLAADGRSLVYSTYLGGSVDDFASGIAVDSAGSIYVAGSTVSDNFPTAQAYDDSYNRLEDAFITKLQLPDLSAKYLEVTQAIQSLDHDVRLVAFKPTVVRFHVKSSSGDPLTTARLVATNGAGASVTLGAPEIKILQFPDRSVREYAFLFYLPLTHLQGTVTLKAELNPHQNPPENDYTNNITSTTVSFEPVPRPYISFYLLGYGPPAHPQLPTSKQFWDTVNWIESAYPIDKLEFTMRTQYYSPTLFVDLTFNCVGINTFLAFMRDLDLTVPLNARHYGMVAANIGGCAFPNIPRLGGLVASGDASVPTNGAHEIGHMYGRLHGVVPACPITDPINGGLWGETPPNPDANISPVTDYADPNAIFGFDMQDHSIYAPTTKDLMSYCPGPDWMSDYTYHGLMDYFQNPLLPEVQRSANNVTDRLAVFGFADLDTNQVNLQPLFVIPNLDDVEPRTPGDYAIVMRNALNQELARYPFSPDTGADVPLVVFTEFVPYVAGTVRVEIEQPDGSLLTSISAGASAPVVNVTAPNGGETLAGDTVTVSWTASDSDGDPLRFTVRYSSDQGATWYPVAHNITETHAIIDAHNLSGSTQALFQVLASDGIHTSIDASDTPFTVPNHRPIAEITEPVAPVTIAMSQTLGLRAYVYDFDTGSMETDQIQWHSNLDSRLGEGKRLDIIGLSPGVHTITLEVDDGAGGVVTDTVAVTVVADLSQLPPTPDGLLVGPSLIMFDPARGAITRSIGLDNQNFSHSIAWAATTNEDWVQLSAAAGTTPATMTVMFHDPGLPAGFYTDTITFTSADVPDNHTTVDVEVTILNQAPVLNPAGDPFLTAIHEDEVANIGTLVSAIISSVLPLDMITDPSLGALEGLAIIAVNNDNGKWQYSTDDGLTWLALGNPSSASARLLAADANTRLRFVPNINFNGTVDPALTFRAWDQIGDSNGRRVNTIANGGNTAFSLSTETARITVLPVNKQLYLPIIAK